MAPLSRPKRSPRFALTPSNVGLAPSATAPAAPTRASLQSKATDWRTFLTETFPSYVRAGFAQRHIEFWDWVWAIQKGERPRPFVAIWPRGGGKSTSAELAVAMWGLRKTRSYVLYVCETQDQADKHVATIASLLESAGVERALNKYGHSKGWRRNRLRAQGFTVDALGLDTAARGIKTEDQRPDAMVFDDLDARHDLPAATQKKIETLTQSVLPAGSNDCAVLGVQNLIHANSIFARLADRRADFLADRIVSGPFRAIENFTYEVVNGIVHITGGVATWAGQSLEACANAILTWGFLAFKREAQHDVADAPGALWTRALIEELRVSKAPELRRVVTAIDPSGNDGNGDECGIVTAGLAMCECRGFAEEHAFVLEDASLLAGPNEWAKAGVASYHRNHADALIAEGNFGGTMVETVIQTVEGAPPVTIIHASRGKQARAEPVASLYKEHKVHHVGAFPQLEDEQCQWEPNTGAPSPNRLDAGVWALTELLLGGHWLIT